MCYTMLFESISSDCTLDPKHVVQTKLYFLCDQMLHQMGIPIPGNTNASGNANEDTGSSSSSSSSSPPPPAPNPYVSVFESDTESESESDTDSFVVVETATSSTDAPAAEEEAPADDNAKHCAEEDCIPVGMFGSSRVTGGCPYCEGVEEGDTITVGAVFWLSGLDFMGDANVSLS
ncbi:hypothetical protein P175DRAFT_0493448 [Aspergillus ochraceoroseus IBT 24754]|uniref:Uncharacterized protein n=1 Tax=Aspergillus ochraceoroseus IBT 24754 TaxID=1392256 RepID=A0A2T5LXZ5_9EURO|nr:uncharacterized protein P175DRAFT_0493448 [Aspergillus ochraceoroseus IBT 24754]PTU21157.1 hypothetical protein P175DRAFT_0493448 [Aspergillus ochraceoroseus IBT 24754]